MKKLFFLILAFVPLIGCSNNMAKRLDVTGPERPMVMLTGETAKDVVLFVGNVQGACEPLAVIASSDFNEVISRIDPPLRSVSESKNEATRKAAGQEILEILSGFTVGNFGGCLLPVGVKGDALDGNGQPISRNIVCPAGEFATQCASFELYDRIGFRGKVTGDTSGLYYIPDKIQK